MNQNQEAIEQASAPGAVSSAQTPPGSEPGMALARNGARPLKAVGGGDGQGSERRERLRGAAKRGMDLVLSLLGLVLLAPLWLVIALLIKLDTPGPVLYRQRRIGRGGEMFGMVKFRTMIDGAHAQRLHLLHMNEAADGLFKISADPRVTRFGAWLRSTSLDELPQLLNVIKGQMSVVGPRPLVPEEDELIEGRHRVRLGVRPGMTGPWQVAGASRIPISKMAELDYDYVRSWTIRGDLRLILGTLPHVLGRRGI